jgi:hypothetical protein
MMAPSAAPTRGIRMSDWWQYAVVGVLVLILGYVVVTTIFSDSITSRGTTRNRGISGERGDEYRDRSAL